MGALHRLAALRVRSRLQSGSSSPVVVETAGGAFVAKLRGAGQGTLALVAEIVVAELAEALGLPVPERVLIELPAEVPSADKNDELADLLASSSGLNLGFRHLEGARDPRSEALRALDDDLVARVLWLDGLTQNPDRSARNPNILLWNGRPWLIDHGAALPFQHDFGAVRETTPREVSSFADHVFAERVGLLPGVDGELALVMTAKRLQQALAAVPDEFLQPLNGSLERTRAAYHAYLWKRLKPPRPFVPSDVGPTRS